jgi:two-component system chemotaxis response regulator CheY
MKYLVVEDSGVMQRIHSNTLKENNVREEDILTVSDGEEALRVAQNQDIDIFLVDWNMPKLDGLKLVQVLRSMEKYRDAPIIMITSEAAKYNVVEAINAGVTNYIIKPVRGNTLWDKIKKYVEE